MGHYDDYHRLEQERLDEKHMKEYQALVKSKVSKMDLDDMKILSSILNSFEDFKAHLRIIRKFGS